MVDGICVGHLKKKNRWICQSRLGITFVILLGLVVLVIFFWGVDYFCGVRLLSMDVSWSFGEFPCHEQCCFNFSVNNRRRISGISHGVWKIVDEERQRRRVRYEKDGFRLFSTAELMNHYSFVIDYCSGSGNEYLETNHYRKLVREIVAYNSMTDYGVVISTCLRQMVKYLVTTSERLLGELYSESKFRVLLFYRIDIRVDRFDKCVNYYLGVVLQENQVRMSSKTFRTIHLAQCTFNEIVLVEKNMNSPHTRINFVIGLINRREKIQSLVLNLVELFSFDQRMHEESNLRVIIFDFHSTDINIEEFIHRSIRDKNIRKRFVVLRPLKSTKWNKVYALNKAMSYIRNEMDIAFVLDVDMRLPLDFAERIRAHTSVGRMVFIPECFSVYREREVRNSVVNGTKNRWTNKIPHRIKRGSEFKENELSELTGWWRTLGTGMIGFFVKDFESIGRYSSSFGISQSGLSNWGLEDTDLMLRFIKKGYAIARTREMNYFHTFHEKSEFWNYDEAKR